MNVTELIAALQPLAPDTPVSRELLAALAPVDEVAIYGGGPASFHPSIYAFRRQRFMRAADRAKRAIAMLRDAGWNARVTEKSIGCKRHFVTGLEFVLTPRDTGPGGKPFCGSYEDQRAAEDLIRDLMRGWPYAIDNGWAITEEAHRRQFDAALGSDGIDGIDGIGVQS